MPRMQASSRPQSPPYSAPIKLLGKNAQTVPMTERMNEMVMTVVATTFSPGVISSLNSFR